MFNRKANDGSFKPFEPIPEGRQMLVVTEAIALPKVNPNTLKLTFSDAKGRTMKASWNQDKKDAKGRLTQRYYMNVMVDALMGDATSFAPTDLLGKFVEVDVVHNEVHKKVDDELQYDDKGEAVMTTFANIKAVIGEGTPFVIEGEAKPDDDLDEMFGKGTDEDDVAY